jgi:hypothetical protein
MFMFGFQAWSLCKGIISPSPPDVNKKYPGPKKWRHFDWPSRIHKKGNFENLKKWQNPEDHRILKLFSDLKNSTFKYLYRPYKMPHLSRQGAHIEVHSNGWKDRKNQNILHGLWR